MSRHTLRAVAPDRSVIVGWDRPMGTYFAHVRALDRDQDDQLIVWLGGDYHEITTAEDLMEAIRPFAVIPDGLQDVLEAEAREDFLAGAYSNVERDWRLSVAARITPGVS